MDYAVRITLAPTSPEPTYTGGFWASGVAKLSGGAVASGWTPGKLIEVSQVGESVDIAKGGNYAILSDCTVTLTATGWATAVAAGVSLHNATVEVGTLSGSALTPRWVGYVADVEWTGAVLTLTIESLAGRRHQEIPARTLTSQEFHNLPSASEGKGVPIIWGSVERSTPPKYSQDREYLGAFYQVASGAGTERSVTFLYSVPTDEDLVLAIKGSSDGSSFTLPATSWTDVYANGGDVYVEISSGTGSGQSRKVTGPSLVITTHANLETVGLTLESAFSPQPSITSVIKVFTNSSYVSLAVCDEGEGFSVSTDIDDAPFPLITKRRTIDSIEISDISDEFLDDGKYDAIKYYPPTENYGSVELSDLISETGPTLIPYCKLLSLNVGSLVQNWLISDILCRGYVDVEQIAEIESVDNLNLLISIDDLAGAGKVVMNAVAVGYDGSIEPLVNYYRRDQSTSDDYNAYSPGITTDGKAGNYSGFKAQFDSSIKPLISFYRVYFSACIEPSSMPPSSIPAFVGAYTSGSASLSIGFDSGLSSYTPVAGDRIRPVIPYTPISDDSEWLNSRTTHDDADAGISPRKYIGGLADDWRVIQTAVWNAGTSKWDITILTGYGWTLRSTDWIFAVISNAGASPFHSATQREAGIAVSHGQASPTSTYNVNVATGREYSASWPALPSGKSIGDPIELASHAVLDMMYRDLHITNTEVDWTTVWSLNARTIGALIPSKTKSEDVYSQMCREFNWIAAHDQDGRETAKNWLGSLGAAAQDYNVYNSDIIEESFEGPQMTAIEDIISMPAVSRSWTQADGFRSIASVLSFDVEPASLTTSNYLQYMPGWDSFAQAYEAYGILYANWVKYGVKQSGPVEYKYTSDIQSQLIDDRLLHWISSRKEILEFSVRDNHAGAFATLGKRFAVTHKRHAPGTKRGTLVARYWNPEKRTVQLTVMIDP